HPRRFPGTSSGPEAPQLCGQHGEQSGRCPFRGGAQRFTVCPADEWWAGVRIGQCCGAARCESATGRAMRRGIADRPDDRASPSETGEIGLSLLGYIILSSIIPHKQDSFRHFAEVYGTRVSKGTTSRITDKVIGEIRRILGTPLWRSFCSP